MVKRADRDEEKSKRELKAVGAFEIVPPSGKQEQKLLAEAKDYAALGENFLTFSDYPTEAAKYRHRSWSLPTAVVHGLLLAECGQLRSEKADKILDALLEAAKGTDFEDEALYVKARWLHSSGKLRDAQVLARRILEEHPGTEGAALCRRTPQSARDFACSGHADSGSRKEDRAAAAKKRRRVTGGPGDTE